MHGKQATTVSTGSRQSTRTRPPRMFTLTGAAGGEEGSVGKRQQCDWSPREDSWEESVFTWYEQLAQSPVPRRIVADQEALIGRLPDGYAERDDRDAPSSLPDEPVRALRQ